MVDIFIEIKAKLQNFSKDWKVWKSGSRFLKIPSRNVNLNISMSEIRIQ